jgi:serine/threonine protein kinase
LENVLLDADDNVKICDFGFARFTQKNQYLETFCGSLAYSAPGKSSFITLMSY